MRNLIIILLFLLPACGTEPGAFYVPPGPKGDQGESGAQGPSGQDGHNGADAVPITVVQFCPGYTPTYPTSFPESALCIQGTLWATFWMGGSAWSGIVPPGIYNSTSTGASCSFNVAANCVVSQ